MKKFIAAIFATLLSACATPYGAYGIAGGYKDARVDENTFSIQVDNNGLTSQKTTSMHALYRAAELTIANGFDYLLLRAEQTPRVQPRWRYLERA